MATPVSSTPPVSSQPSFPAPRTSNVTTHVDGEIGYLQWTAPARGARVEHGTDTFVISDGPIRAQTWYYRVESDYEARPPRLGSVPSRYGPGVGRGNGA
jgi:hypothetical protein